MNSTPLIHLTLFEAELDLVAEAERREIAAVIEDGDALLRERVAALDDDSGSCCARRWTRRIAS